MHNTQRWHHQPARVGTRGTRCHSALALTTAERTTRRHAEPQAMMSTRPDHPQPHPSTTHGRQTSAPAHPVLRHRLSACSLTVLARLYGVMYFTTATHRCRRFGIILCNTHSPMHPKRFSYIVARPGAPPPRPDVHGSVQVMKLSRTTAAAVGE